MKWEALIVDIMKFEPAPNYILVKRHSKKISKIELTQEIKEKMQKEIMKDTYFEVVKVGSAVGTGQEPFKSLLKVNVGDTIWPKPHSSLTFYHQAKTDDEMSLMMIPESDVMGVMDGKEKA